MAELAPLLVTESSPAAEAAATPAAPPATADDDAALSTVGAQQDDDDGLKERLCVICLTDPVEIMLLPCRHAVLCRGCASTVREGDGFGRGGDACCPLCRAPVSGVVLGSFAEDFVRMLTEAERRIGSVQASMYEGMYNRVRICMSVGALTGTGAAACFILLPLPLAIVPGVALAGASFWIGYVPWFLTTVAAFEQNDSAIRERSPLQLFTREDLSKPLTLLTKGTMLVLGVPIAAVSFFVPYFCYTFVVRPVCRLALQGLLRGTVFTIVYVVVPTWGGIGWTLGKVCEGIVWTARGIAWTLGKVCQGIVWTAGRLCEAVAWTAEKLWLALTTVADAVYTYALVPVGNAAWAVAEAVGRAICASGTCLYDNVLHPGGQGIGHAASLTYEHLLLPCGRASSFAVQATGNCIKSSAVATHTNVLSPAWNGICKVVTLVGYGVSKAAEAFLEYVVIPSCKLFCNIAWYTGRAIGGAFYHTARGIAGGVHLVYKLVLVPVGGVLVDGATMLYAYVLVPSGRCLGSAAMAIAGAVAAVAGGVAGGVAAFVSAIGSGLAAGASALYSYVVVPVGGVLLAVASGVWDAVVAVASAVASGFAAGASATYSYVIVPIGSLLQAIASAMLEGARQAYTHVVAPVASATGAAAAATAAAVCDATAWAGSRCGEVAAAASEGVSGAVSACRQASIDVMETVRRVF